MVAKLAERGVAIGPPIAQSDQYFAHPCRNFAETDEALRIRTVGGTSYVTYKGPKLDATTKTRRELELPVASSDPDGSRFAALLAAVGFTPVLTVRKSRRPFVVSHKGLRVHGALDEVEGLGTFVELELSVDENGVDPARRIGRSRTRPRAARIVSRDARANAARSRTRIDAPGSIVIVVASRPRLASRDG